MEFRPSAEDAGDRFLRWLYNHAPIARPEVRKRIRATVGVRDCLYRSLKWRCRPGDNATERSIWVNGATDEEREIDWLIARLKPGQIFCDIGANCGAYALSLRSATGCRVIAIEPNPIMRGRLQENLALNEMTDVTIEPVAIGEAAGRMELHFGAKHDFGQASLLEQTRGDGGVEVEVAPLSDILARQGVARADAIKIDVEGYEDHALGPFLETVADTALPSSLVVEHLHQKIWAKDLKALALSRGFALAETTQNNFLFTR